MYDAGADTGYLRFETNNGSALTKALDIDKNQNSTFYGTLQATNLSGSNTGDQTLPTLSSLGALSASGTAFSLSGTDVTVGDSITLAGGLSYSGTTLTSANDNTTYTAGTGLTLTGTAFNLDYPVRVLQNQDYAPSDGSSSGNNSTNRANYGMGLTIYEGYNVGTDRPHTYDTTAQFMSTTSQGFELSASWISASNTPLMIRSLRDCCQGWNPWTEVYTEASFSKASVLNSNVTLTSLGAAPLASPGLTGTPTAPTAGATVNTTQLATTAFVQTAVSNLVDSSPGALNTLNELAAALGDDASFSTTVTTSIATKLPLAGGTMTGRLIVDVDASGDGSWDDSGILLRNDGNPTGEIAIAFDNTGTGSNYWIYGLNQGADLKWGYGTSFVGGNDRMTLTTSGNLTVTGTIAASNFSGSSSGTNTGDQTLPTLSSLGALSTSGGTMTGDLTIPSKIIHSGDTNTYIQFHAADQWRVVTAGVERVEVNSGGLTVNGGVTASAATISGGISAGGKLTYSKNAGSLNTTGYDVAGLTVGNNGNSAGFIFTCFGPGGYQRIVYSCWNTSGTTWNVEKVIDEGTNHMDITVSASGSERTFTFVSRSGSLNYTPRVTVEATGHSINNTYA
jgi:hypothetical protein